MYTLEGAGVLNAVPAAGDTSDSTGSAGGGLQSNANAAPQSAVSATNSGNAAGLGNTGGTTGAANTDTTTGLANSSGTTTADSSQGFIAVREFPILNLPAGQTSQIQLPENTFEHATQTDGFQLTASMSDGSPLPQWVTFDSSKGTFTLEPHKGTAAKLDVRITARDHEGRTATAGLVLNVH